MRNIVFAMITKLALVVSGVITQRFILHGYGSEINGLTSSITQFLTYFSLLEAGLGIASVQALYKPLYANDFDSVNGILAATSSQYKKTGLLFLVFTVVLAIAMPFISTSSLDNWLVIIITLLMGLANVLNYLFIGRYQVLLTADRNIFVIHILDAVLGIAFAVIRVLMVNAGLSIVLVQTVALLSPMARMAVLYVYTKIRYPEVSHVATPNYQAISKRKFVLTHQAVGMVTNHTATIILTVFSTLTTVSVYSVYNLIYSNVHTVVSTTFSSATQASFARLYEAENKKFNLYYSLYEMVYTFLLFALMTAVLIMTLPFVRLYTYGIENVDYVDFPVALLFMISMLLNLVRIPSIIMINIVGSFKETQRGAIIEAVIAFSVSLLGFFVLGMQGLLLGTCVAMIYRSIDVLLYNYRKILNMKIIAWVAMFGVNVGISILYYTLCVNVIDLPTDTWGRWFAAGVIYSILGLFMFGIPLFVIYLAWYRKKLK